MGYDKALELSQPGFRNPELGAKPVTTGRGPLSERKKRCLRRLETSRKQFNATR